MIARFAALIGVVGAAAVGFWMSARRSKSAVSATKGASLLEVTATPSLPSAVDIDDDRAAEIIKRARPALERARGIE